MKKYKTIVVDPPWDKGGGWIMDKEIKKCKHKSWRGSTQLSEGGGLYIFCNGCPLAEVVKQPKRVRMIAV